MHDIIVQGIKNTINLSGEVWECGTYKGDTAMGMRAALNDTHNNRILRMFDTFSGQPFCGPHDGHAQGTMHETNYYQLKERFKSEPNTHIHSGIMPFTFSGLEDVKLSISNIDVDNYKSVKDCLEFIYPRTEIGGYIFLDDYGCVRCKGAKIAVDEFLSDKKEKIMGGCAPNGFIIKQ